MELQQHLRAAVDPARGSAEDLAVQASCQEKITEGQLAAFLRCDRVTAREIVAECSNQLDISPEGDESVYHMPFEQSLLRTSS